LAARATSNDDFPIGDRFLGDLSFGSISPCIESQRRAQKEQNLNNPSAFPNEPCVNINSSFVSLVSRMRLALENGITAWETVGGVKVARLMSVGIPPGS
jgi:hypothetical protein